jgi:hypothetical protein
MMAETTIRKFTDRPPSRMRGQSDAYIQAALWRAAFKLG